MIAIKLSMESILDNILVFEDLSLRGFVFGFVHVALILIGYYTGWSINRFLKILSKGYIAGIIGAASAHVCLLYTSPSPRDKTVSRMPSSA